VESVQSDDARRKLRDLLNRVEHDGEHITILRYQTPAAVIVPPDWYEQAKAAIGKEASHGAQDQ
jgi:prevent-host-death family protein